MGIRDVLVRIKGEESVSDAAKKSEGALGAVTSKLGTMVKAIGALAAGAALAKFFKDSIESANDAERSVATLTAALKPLGIEYKNVEREVEDTLSALQASTRFGDEEYRDALTRMVVTNKDLKGSLEVLPAVAGFAIAKQLDLGSASDLVAKAMAGQTSVLSRYGIQVSDASQVVDVFKAQFGAIAGADGATFQARIAQLGNAWDDFKEATGRAILSSGAMQDATGGLAGKMGELAQWVSENETQFAALGQAAGWVIDATVKAVAQIGLTIQSVKVIGADAGALWQTIPAKVRAGIGAVLQSVGQFISSNRVLLTLMGDTATQVGDDLANTGARMQREAVRTLGEVEREHEKAYDRIFGTVQAAEKKTTNAVVMESTARVTANKQATAAVTEDHLKMEIARQKAARESSELFQKTIDAIKKINLKEHADEWAEIDRNVRMVKGDLSDLLPTAEDLKREIEQNKKFMQENAEAAKDNRGQIEDSVRGAADLGRAFVDIAQAAGILSSEAASSLNSVLNMGVAISKIGVDPVGGIIGVVGGLANLIGNWGNSASEKERKRVMEQLSQAIQENTDALKIGSTGATIAGASGAISAALPFASRGTSRTAFFQELATRNVSQQDFFDLAQQFGFGDAFKTTDDTAFAPALRALQDKIGDTPLRAGDSFRQQLAALNDIGDLTGQSETDRLSAISKLAADESSALREALFGGLAGLGTGGLLTEAGRAGAAQQLKDLLLKLGPGGTGIDAAALGGLSPQDLIDAIRQLLPLLGSENIDFGGPGVGGSFGGAGIGALIPSSGGVFDGPAFLPSVAPGSALVGGSGNTITVSVNIEQLGDFKIDAEGRPVEQVGEALADVVARKIANKLALQNSALGVS